MQARSADLQPIDGHARPPNNLTAPRTRFIGRERELISVQRLLHDPDTGLLTLVGPGGSGKTRLALRVAANSLAEFEDGVYFISLGALAESQLVLPTIARTLGMKDVEGRSPLDGLREELRSKHVLLVLDNFEQVVAAAPAVVELLPTCPALKLLVTSRSALRVYGEREYGVPPLDMPDPKEPLPWDVPRQYEAVQLFIERARDVKPDFAVTNENAAAVAGICARLDGLPLAIELAAARSRVLSPQAILARLARRLSLLTGGPIDLPVRHQTLRNTIAWSHDLLTAEEQRLFRRLGVFVGGCTLEAIDGACDLGVEQASDIVDLVSSLSDKSLVQQFAAVDAEPRFQMLQTVREYAMEVLDEAGELHAAQERHAAYYLDLATQAEPHLRGSREASWFAALEQEHDNLRAALRWLTQRGTGNDAEAIAATEQGLRLAIALRWFWYEQGHVVEGHDRMTALLELGGAVSPGPVRASALSAAGWLSQYRGDFVLARAQLEESLGLFQELRDTRGTAWALAELGVAEFRQGNSAAAQSLLESSLTSFREVDDRHGLALVLTHLSMNERWADGDSSRAYARAVESLALNRELEDAEGVCRQLLAFGLFALLEGDYVAAEPRLREGLQIATEHGYEYWTALLLEGFSSVAHGQQDVVRALRLAAAAHALRERIGMPSPPFWRNWFGVQLEDIRQVVEVGAYAAAWAAGRTLTVGDAIGLALAEPESSRPNPTPGDAQTRARPDGPLTQREREIVGIVAEGLTNRAIADRLVLSERTVDAHLAHIRDKLGLRSRAQVAAWAVEQRLTSSRSS